MGQYYHPLIIVVAKNCKASVVAWVSARAYGSGVKQMEHAYLDDKFVGAFEWLISPEGPHHKGQVVWAGDYGLSRTDMRTPTCTISVTNSTLRPPRRVEHLIL